MLKSELYCWQYTLQYYWSSIWLWTLRLFAGGWLLAFTETSHKKSATLSFVVRCVIHCWLMCIVFYCLLYIYVYSVFSLIVIKVFYHCYPACVISKDVCVCVCVCVCVMAQFCVFYVFVPICCHLNKHKSTTKTSTTIRAVIVANTPLLQLTLILLQTQNEA